MIAVAVSPLNGCDYYVTAHAVALKAMGAGNAELVETMRMVDLFRGFNKMPGGLQAPPDVGVLV